MPRKTNLSRRTRAANAKRRSIAKQTEEQRSSIKEQQRQRMAQRRAEETPDQRETRLRDARLRAREKRFQRSQHNARQRLRNSATKPHELVPGSNIIAIKWGWGKQERQAVEVNQDGGRGSTSTGARAQRRLAPRKVSPGLASTCLPAPATLGEIETTKELEEEEEKPPKPRAGPCSLFWLLNSAGRMKETDPAKLVRMEGGRCTVDLVKLSSASLPTTSEHSLPGTSERSDEVWTLLDPDQRALHKEVKKEDHGPSRW